MVRVLRRLVALLGWCPHAHRYLDTVSDQRVLRCESCGHTVPVIVRTASEQQKLRALQQRLSAAKGERPAATVTRLRRAK